MVDPGKKDAAIPALIDLSSQHRLGLPKDPARFDVLKGEYDFAQLFACENVVLGALLDSDLLRSIWIDDFKNRIRLGIGDLAAESEIRLKVARLGVPDDMLEIEEEGFPDQTNVENAANRF